jgi:hypothetical protein
MHLTPERIELAEGIYEEIIDNYGWSHHHDHAPILRLYYDPRGNPPLYGYYDTETMCVNFARCRTWRNVVETMIHEYAHHMQDPGRTDTEECEAEAAAIALDGWRLFV